MDVAVEGEGPLDPRIQIELENLNNSTDEINKLEIELDEAHTAFRQLLSDSTRRLKEIANKLGSSCIEKARCYYEAVEVARRAQVQCQQQAQMFQRASEIHAAAKETVALAEARFVAHQHEWNFDQAWQDMLNHATIKVMDADNQKAECGREHHRRAMLFHDAETKVQQLEEKHRRAIIKSRPYFEVRAQCEQMLSTQKERVECLQKGVKDAKTAYAASLRALEGISNQIHQQRRDNDIMAKGPREPGVGAELISPAESLSYDAELNKLSISRINSLASSEPDMEDRAQDFEDVYDLKQRIQQLSVRSVDGSESTSSQWELELQASVEKLNSLPTRKSSFGESDKKNEVCEDSKYSDISELSSTGCYGDSSQSGLPRTEKSLKNDQNEYKKLATDFQIFKKPLSRTDSKPYNSLTHSPINSILNKSKIAIKNSFSKSLNNSPVNVGNFYLAKSKPEETISQHICNENFNSPRNETNIESEDTICDYAEPISQSVQSDSKIQNIAEGVGSHLVENVSPKKKITVDRSDLEIAEFAETPLDSLEIQKELEFHQINKTEHRLQQEPGSKRLITVSETRGRVDPHKLVPAGTSGSNQYNLHTTERQRGPATQKFNFASHSVDSTPVKRGILSKSKTAKSYENHLDLDFVDCPKLEKSDSKTSSVKELPLLSIFERSVEPRFSKDKSCSMVNLTEKRNLKALLGSSNLGNIQAVSVERLAVAKHNLVGAGYEQNK